VTTAVKQLLQQSWQDNMQRRGLPLFELSSRRRTLWFPHGSVAGDTVAFTGVDGKTQHRDLYGYKTMTRVNGDTYQRFWHFGLEVVPILYPSPVLALKSHVVFTLDGKTIAGDAKVQHRARRSQCKRWWNDKWRDLMLSAVTRICEGGTTIRLEVAEDCEILMASQPITYQSSVSYEDKEIQAIPDDETYDDIDDEDTEGAESEEAEQAVAVANPN
jgi:hypothetical protein